MFHNSGAMFLSLESASRCIGAALIIVSIGLDDAHVTHRSLAKMNV
jgi:hypothetical protein